MRVTHTGAAGTVSETLSGWTIGAGADFAVTPNLILRAEYLYADYGSSTFGFAGGVDPHVIDLRNNIIRGAAIWKF